MVKTKDNKKKKVATSTKAATKPSLSVSPHTKTASRRVLSKGLELALASASASSSTASTTTSQTTTVRKLPESFDSSAFFEAIKKRNNFPDVTSIKPIPSRHYVTAIDDYKRADRWGGTREVDGKVKPYVLVGTTEKDEIKYEIKVETYLLWKAEDKDRHLTELMHEKDRLWFRHTDGREYLDWSTIDLMVDTDWKLLRFVPPQYYDHEAVRRGFINATMKSGGHLLDYLFKNNLWKK